MPTAAQAEVKVEFWKIFDDIDTPAGQGAVDVARARIAAFEKRYATTYPAAVKCLTTDVASLTVYLRFPKEHWKRIRHSNFIERTFGETRRRVKVIGRLPGERSCLSLVWAVLDRASKGWRGVQAHAGHHTTPRRSPPPAPRATAFDHPDRQPRTRGGRNRHSRRVA